LKQASAQKAGECVIVGAELEEGQLAVKDMATGEQRLVNADEFLSQLKV
jgi:histidyl-tRNA synthetase